MAHAHKPDLAFQRNGRVHLNRRGCQFSRLLAAEERGSADSNCIDRCSDVQCKTTGYPLHSHLSPSLPPRASLYAIRFWTRYTLHEDYETFLIISRSVLLEWEMFQTKVVVKLETHVLCSTDFVFKNRAVYEIMWKKFADRSTPQMTILRMPIACRIPKATNSHTGCVIIIAYPRQQWLH